MISYNTMVKRNLEVAGIHTNVIEPEDDTLLMHPVNPQQPPALYPSHLGDEKNSEAAKKTIKLLMLLLQLMIL